jgi:Tol biopolymer transport system component
MIGMYRLCWVVLGMVGCGTVSAIESDGSPPDPDSTAAPAACDPRSPFTEVEPVAALNTPTYECCAVFDDVGNVYFSRAGATPSGSEIWTAPVEAGTFGDRRKLVTPTTEVTRVWNPTVTRDGLTMYFVGESTVTTGDTTTNRLKLYVTSRGSVGEDFAPALEIALANPSPAPIDADPYLSPDGSWLYFASDADGNNLNIVRARRTSATVLGAREPITLANSDGADNHPVVNRGLTSLYYASTRSGGGDIYVLHADSIEPQLVPVEGEVLINSEGAEAPSWVSPDDCELYFSSRRDDNDDLWVARRTRPQ